jgi:DHA2 family multidrug resistance protein
MSDDASMSETQRWAITISIMLATVMNSLDTTIANVALPHIQGSVQASQDQITWVLTSYIIAAAVMTPLSSWLAGRFGRKLLFLISIGGFTGASVLCGTSTSLLEIVLFRFLQGLCGASLIPLSQAVLLDIYPAHRHGQAMAIWGAGAVLGPILGPALGGWLTDNLDWRWVFLINLPVGILAFMGVWVFIHDARAEDHKPFDFFGFGALTLALASSQLLMDRGPSQDWFSSSEIWTYAILGVIGFYLFALHTVTARHPFFDRALAQDRNFLVSTCLGFFVGVLLFSSMALLPTMMETILGYPVVTTGVVSMPRGIGSFISMFIVGQLITRVDVRALVLTGLTLSAIAVWQMTNFSLEMDSQIIIWSGLIQGLGTGMIFVPLSTLAFATLSPKLRTEGAAVYTLVRNIGSSIGISLMQAQHVAAMQTARTRLAEHITQGAPSLHDYAGSAFDMTTQAGAAMMNAFLMRQASMMAYVGDFRLLLVLTIVIAPLLLILRKPKPHGGEIEVVTE